MEPNLDPKMDPKFVEKFMKIGDLSRVGPGSPGCPEILAKPQENHDFHRVRGVAPGSVLGSLCGPQGARKITSNSDAFFDGFLKQKGAQNGALNGTKNASKNRSKNETENVPKNGAKRDPKMTIEIQIKGQ